MQHVPIAFNINNRILQIPAHRLFLFASSLNTDPTQFHLGCISLYSTRCGCVADVDKRLTLNKDGGQSGYVYNEKRKKREGKEHETKKEGNVCIHITEVMHFLFLFRGPAGQAASR